MYFRKQWHGMHWLSGDCPNGVRVECRFLSSDVPALVSREMYLFISKVDEFRSAPGDAPNRFQLSTTYALI